VLRAVVLTQYRRVTDGQTDGQTDGIAVASTALAKRRAVKMGHMTLTTPLSGAVWHAWLGLATVNLITKSEVSNSTGYEDMKGNAKRRKLSGLEYLEVTQGDWK